MASFNVTDSGFSYVLRPIINKPRYKLKYPMQFIYQHKPYNNLVVKRGIWTAKHHMILDTLYDRSGGKMNIKGLKSSYPYLKKWRKYQIEKMILEIADFDFIASKDNRTIVGPILHYKKGIVTFNHGLNKKVTIPHRLYKLSDNAQFLYRRFFVYKKRGATVNINFDTLIEYLNLTAEKHHSRARILGYLNELKSVGLLNKLREKCQNKTHFLVITK
ncbi:MAG: hypothetical protein ACXAC2_15495 [Candidatus Kariarchaeaceae archaeon]|jgi:hypothetical protein